MDLKLTDKRVLITGGGSGIGAAAAAAFAAEGAKVAVNYIGEPDQANHLCATLQASGVEAFSLKADVAEPQDVQAMFSILDTRWGGLDVLINNAGVDGPRALAWDADIAAWSKVVQVNFTGAFMCAREALKRMIPARRGVIINTTSVHEVIAWTGYSAYVGSKAGLAMVAKTLAQEAAPYGVRVLSVAPGAIRTAINHGVWEDQTAYADLLRKIPLNRIGEATEVAAMMVILASDVASYVTATTVFVDGGMTDYPDFARGG